MRLGLLFIFFILFLKISSAQAPAGQAYHPTWLSTSVNNPNKTLKNGYKGFVFERKPSENLLRSFNDLEDSLYVFLPNSTLTHDESNRLLAQFGKLKFFDKNKINKKLQWLKNADLNGNIKLDDKTILLELNDTTSTAYLNFVLDSIGLIPDYIVHPGSRTIPDSLSRVYEAVVNYNNQSLKQVKYKEFPKITVSGPFYTRSATLSPYKRGYYFSPDIFNFTDRNNINTGAKTFRAFKYALTEELRFSLPLSGNSVSRTKTSDKLKTMQLSYTEDPQRGNVASFNGQDSYIYLRSENIEDTKELSIAAWVKPQDVNGSYSLLGKGQAYSAKIYWGRLQFTTPGIKDHTTSSRVLKKNEWQHIAYSFIPGDQINFYVNGRLVERVEASEINPTSHAILIGSNLWGQHYNGLMSDLNVWDRALSDEELEQVYQEGIDPDDKVLSPALLWSAGTLLLLIIITLIVYRIYRRKNYPSSKQNLEPKVASIPSKNTIELLNGFKINSEKYGDLSNKFSPKRKALLTLILFYTIKNEGISTKKLSDMLWPGFSAQKQKNNRSTQLKELRNTLQEYEIGEVLYEEKKWQFIGRNDFFIDLFELDRILPHFLNRKIETTPVSAQQILDFAKILLKGPLLPHADAEWMDAIKAEFNDRCLELLNTHVIKVSEDKKLLVYDAMLIIDPLFENAVEAKAHLLRCQGKHMSARRVIDDFKKLYYSYYAEKANQDFLKNFE